MPWTRPAVAGNKHLTMTQSEHHKADEKACLLGLPGARAGRHIALLEPRLIIGRDAGQYHEKPGNSMQQTRISAGLLSSTITQGRETQSLRADPSPLRETRPKRRRSAVARSAVCWNRLLACLFISIRHR
jgi:hypothetical protein